MTMHDTWAAMPLPALVVPAAVGSALASEVRSRLERTGSTRYGLLDRASYDERKQLDEPELLGALTALVKDITARELVLRESRVLRLNPGDYVLVRHDRVHEDRPIEVVLDLSETAVTGAEVHYRHRGQVFFTFESTPGACSLVERAPTVMCNHTYVSKRSAGAVVRLVALFGNA